MASNFDFLKKVDNELFKIVEEGEKLFRDEYFNQSVVQFRIYAEKMAKNISNETNSELTFDTILNNLKDKIKNEREREFIEDLFFIKQEGNKCAHGEDASAITVLEVIRRAFEAAVNYAFTKTKDEKIDKLIFDETLLITQKPNKEEKLIDKYLKAAKNNANQDKELEKENLLNKKQGEFLSSVDKSEDENGFKDKNYIKKPKKKKQLSEKQLKIKEEIKKAKKNLKENINKEKETKKSKNKTKNKAKSTQKTKNQKIKDILYAIFILTSIFFLCKMIFIF